MVDQPTPRSLLREENKETLRRYEKGESETALSRALGVSRSAVKHRLDKYRVVGVLVGSWSGSEAGAPKVDWEQLEAMEQAQGLPGPVESKPPRTSAPVASQVAPLPPTEPAAPAPTETPAPPAPVEASAPLAPVEAPTPSTKGAFTKGEIRSLKRLAAREARRSTAGVEDTGTKTMRNFRVDDGLWDAVKSQAAVEKVSATKLVERALREYLGAD